MARLDRVCILLRLGARPGAEWFQWPTVTAVLDSAVLFIACDPVPAPDDWDSVCVLLRLSGYHSRADGRARDPGRPDDILGYPVWRLALPRSRTSSWETSP